MVNDRTVVGGRPLLDTPGTLTSAAVPHMFTIFDISYYFSLHSILPVLLLASTGHVMDILASHWFVKSEVPVV